VCFSGKYYKRGVENIEKSMKKTNLTPHKKKKKKTKKTPRAHDTTKIKKIAGKGGSFIGENCRKIHFSGRKNRSPHVLLSVKPAKIAGKWRNHVPKKNAGGKKEEKKKKKKEKKRKKKSGKKKKKKKKKKKGKGHI
jgi:hypothetical protein